MKNCNKYALKRITAKYFFIKDIMLQIYNLNVNLIIWRHKTRNTHAAHDLVIAFYSFMKNVTIWQYEYSVRAVMTTNCGVISLFKIVNEKKYTKTTVDSNIFQVNKVHKKLSKNI